ncbi:MAG: PAS domain-containing protein, partial [Methanospirillum sp.]|nr:PAS domain-containing protein [Methanospirillum sp.]
MKEKPLSRQYPDGFSLPVPVFFDTVPDPVCILDPGFHIVYRNLEFNSLFFPLNNPSGTGPDLLFFHLNSSFAANQEQCARIRESCDFVTISTEVTQPDGKKNWFRFRITPLVPGGTLTGFLVFGTDYTREHLQESGLVRTETLLRLIQEVGDFHFFDKDPDGRIQQVVSRAGMVMKTLYSSYIEITGETDNATITERYLWSIRYGYLIGSDFDEEETFSCFYDFFHDLLTRNPVIVPRNRVRGVIGR